MDSRYAGSTCADTSTCIIWRHQDVIHASAILARFSWTIQRLLHGPIRGPVGSSIR